MSQKVGTAPRKPTDAGEIQCLGIPYFAEYKGVDRLFIYITGRGIEADFEAAQELGWDGKTLGEFWDWEEKYGKLQRRLWEAGDQPPTDAEREDAPWPATGWETPELAFVHIATDRIVLNAEATAIFNPQTNELRLVGYINKFNKAFFFRGHKKQCSDVLCFTARKQNEGKEYEIHCNYVLDSLKSRGFGNGDYRAREYEDGIVCFAENTCV